MKKIILFLSCLLILPLSGCSTSSDTNALTSLNNQLERVENVVSSTSSTEVNTVSPYVANPNQDDQLSLLKTEAYSNMTNEENLRQNVLSLNANLKNSKVKYKLGKQKASALNSLSSNLSKYLNYLNNTKSDVQNNVSKIKKSTSSKFHNAEVTKSSYVALSNTMNERYIYLENIYCTLVQINNILENSIDSNSVAECDDCEESTDDDTISSRSNSNIDTYYNSNHTNSNTNENSNHNNANEHANNIDSMQKNEISTPPQFPQNQLPSNYPANYYNNGYYWRMPLNSGRNTDTFYPYMRNIDTYRFSPDFYENLYRGNFNNYNNTIITQSSPVTETKSEDTEYEAVLKSENHLNENEDTNTFDTSSVNDTQKSDTDRDILHENLNFLLTKKDKEKRHVI